MSYWTNDSGTLHCGDVLEVLAGMPENSVQCVVTSPPYWSLRDYGVEGQLGLEKTPAEFVAKMVSVFDGVRRVLREDGVCFVNVGDSYAANRTYQVTDNKHIPVGNEHGQRVPDGLKPKDLCLIPERLAIAFQDSGWWVRSRIAWVKPNPMPESVTDRPTSAWEHIWMLTKSARYYWDAEAVKSPASESFTNDPRWKTGSTLKNMKDGYAEAGAQNPKQVHRMFDKQRELGSNLRNWWKIPTQGYSEAHFATFPEKIPDLCIRGATSEKGACGECGKPWERVVEEQGYSKHRPSAGNDPRSRNEDKQAKGSMGGHHGWKGNNFLRNPPKTKGWQAACVCGADPVPCVVMDPFFGSGTVGVVAQNRLRRWIGIELSEEYCELAKRRIQKDAAQMRFA